jgi:hypothetical protein
LPQIQIVEWHDFSVVCRRTVIERLLGFSTIVEIPDNRISGQLFSSSVLGLDIELPIVGAIYIFATMLRIERSANGQVVFTLSGRMQTEDIEQFRQLLVVETPGQQLLFNLRDVTLVNRDVVAFLADCEANGIKLENCPLHIRNWIDQEKRRDGRRRQKKDMK